MEEIDVDKFSVVYEFYRNLCIGWKNIEEERFFMSGSWGRWYRL